MRRLRYLAAAIMIGVVPMPSPAVEPDEILDDPLLEERAREISAQVRCVVCQNEAIDTSNAGIARDLRILIRERLLAGDTDQEIFDFLVARYGDFVLFKPPFKPQTWALWFAPFLIAAAGAAGVFVLVRRASRQAAPGPERLSEEELAQIEKIMRNEKAEADS